MLSERAFKNTNKREKIVAIVSSKLKQKGYLRREDKDWSSFFAVREREKIERKAVWADMSS